MRVYLDHNATSPLRPQARAAVLQALDLGGNASSVHAEGRSARAMVDENRERLAGVLGVIAPMITFTSGGTEANNCAMRGTAVDRILVSATEHPSITAAAAATGLPVETIPVDGNGVVGLEALKELLPGPKTMISVMLANNETGVIQPLREIATLAQDAGALVHTDAVQALGKVPVNFGLLGVDMMTLTAHKLGGPVGAGALIVRDGLPLHPLLVGGGQELRRRAGTENLPAIAGFAAAATQNMMDIKALRDRLESSLEDAVIIGKDAERLPNTTCFAMPGMSAETLLMAFDLDGIAVSSGSACSSGKVATSHVLSAMGVAPEISRATIRVSLGWNTTSEDIDQFIAAWRLIRLRHKARAAA